MTYVPVIPPTQATQPSPRTRELAELLAKVLEEYTKAHPQTTGSEVRAAMRLALRSSSPAVSGAPTVVALTLGLLVLGLGLGLFLFRSGGGVDPEGSFPMIAVAVAIVLGVLVLLVIRRSR